MAKLELDMETRVPPDRVMAALLDFSPRRPEIWSGIAPSQYEVYSVGQTEAEIKEGTKLPGTMIWAKEHYDWSSDKVTWTVQESNFCTTGSYASATVAPAGQGGSRIHVVWNRTPTSFTGRLIIGLMALTRGKPIVASMKKAFD